MPINQQVPRAADGIIASYSHTGKRSFPSRFEMERRLFLFLFGEEKKKLEEKEEKTQEGKKENREESRRDDGPQFLSRSQPPR